MVANAKIIFEAVFDSQNTLNDIEDGIGGIGEAAKRTAKETAFLNEVVGTTATGTRAFANEIDRLRGLFKAGELTQDEWAEANSRLRASGARTVEEIEALNKELEDANKNTEEAGQTASNASKGFMQFAKGLLGVATVYAGGRWLINFAKDTIGLAKAAGVAADGLEDLGESAERAKVSIGTRLIGALEPAAGALSNYSNALLDSWEATGIVRDMTDEMAASLGFVIRGGGIAATAFDELTGVQLTEVEVLQRLNDAQIDLTGSTTVYTTAANAATIHAANLADAYGDLADQTNLLDMDDLAMDTRLAAEASERAAFEAEAFATGLAVLRASFFPLTELTEDFRESIAGLTAEGETLGIEFGLLEFLTPEQQTQIGDLKSELTGVWIGYRDVLELIEDGDLGARGLTEAEVKAEDLRTQIGFLEAGIINLGGIPYVTQQQAQDARDRIGEIEGEIDNITAAWEEQTNTMIFNMAAQAIALTDLPWQEQMDFLNQLAGPEGLGLVDAAMTTFSQDFLTAFLRMDEGMGVVLADLLMLSDRMNAIPSLIPVEIVISVTGQTAFLTAAQTQFGPPISSSVGGGGQGLPSGQGPGGGIGSGPDPDFSGLTEVVPEGGDAPIFVDSVPITIVTNDPLKAADAVIDVLGKL